MKVETFRITTLQEAQKLKSWVLSQEEMALPEVGGSAPRSRTCASQGLGLSFFRFSVQIIRIKGISALGCLGFKGFRVCGFWELQGFRVESGGSGGLGMNALRV